MLIETLIALLHLLADFRFLHPPMLQPVSNFTVKRTSDPKGQDDLYGHYVLSVMRRLYAFNILNFL